MKEEHGHSFSEGKEGMFTCERCDKKFKTFDVLQKHIKGVHESMHVPCYICAKLVKEGTPMEHHIKYVHTPVQNIIQQRKKFSDEIFIILASITFIFIRIIEFEIKTKGNFEKMQISHFKY